MSNAGGCWEIGLDKLTFTNPEWHNWIKMSQVDICDKLCPEISHTGQIKTEDDGDDVSMEGPFPKMVLKYLRIWRPCAVKE